MISVDDAIKMVFEQANKMPIIDKPLTGKSISFFDWKFSISFRFLECLGYICAEEVVAKEPFPPFRASVKDGYAVRLYSDRSHEQIYEIVGRSDAGGENVIQKTSLIPLFIIISFLD